MGKNSRHKRNKKSDLQRKSGSLELQRQGLQRKRSIVFGLSLLDSLQGEDYEDWEDYKLLSKALSRMQGLCSMTIDEAKQSKIIKEYGNELPDGSSFKFPKHIPDDVNWCSLKIHGKIRLIGYIEDNHIFQIVFLDKNHLFYPSKKKNT